MDMLQYTGPGTRIGGVGIRAGDLVALRPAAEMETDGLVPYDGPKVRTERREGGVMLCLVPVDAWRWASKHPHFEPAGNITTPDAPALDLDLDAADGE
jgi:hypothetical protein